MFNLQQEIEELHAFFEDWFNARLAESGFARFESVTAEGFVIISPDGALTNRDRLVTLLKDAYGARVGVRIWIENVRLHHQHDDIWVATYEEWQQAPSQNPRARLSTAIFQEAANTPNGMQWLHVHETWMPI